ncbi:MAG: CHAD domain-containing protein [Pseudomonadota bacterium]
MLEIELKIALDKAQLAALKTSQTVAALADGAPVTRTLHNVYYDTPDGALRRAGISLRLRREDRRWTQTLKRKTGPMQAGLSTPEEDECAVRGQNLALHLIQDDDLREEVIGLARDGLRPVVITHFRRWRRNLRTGTGAFMELALDEGEVSAGEHKLPILEAELELKSGSPGDLYAIAERIFTIAPLRFATTSKSERIARLIECPDGPALRKARPVTLQVKMTAEQAAHTILSEGLAHASPNLALLLESEDIGGPHQLRVALRRMRSAFSAFRSILGRSTLSDLAATAQWIGAEAGRLRDLDVLAEEIVRPFADATPEETGFTVLSEAVAERRLAIRKDVRTALSRPEVTAFGLQLGRYLAARGWLDPADHGQTVRLAQPVGRVAAKVLTKRWKAVAAYGDRIETLSIDERHEMRKELKKLRYLVDAFKSLYPEDRVAAFMRAVKRLQTAFGALNDAAMAEALLMAPDAPGAGDPAAQRAAGLMIGQLMARSDHLWPQAQTDWRDLAALGPFWR